MQTEYLIMVGNAFLKDLHDWDSTIVLTMNQKDAKRETNTEAFNKIVSKLELYKVPYHLMKIDMTAQIQVVIPNLVKEEVSE